MRAQAMPVAFTLTKRGFSTQTTGLSTGEDDLAFVRNVTADEAWELALRPIYQALTLDAATAALESGEIGGRYP